MTMMSSCALVSIVPDSSQGASFHCYFGYFLVFVTSHNIGSTSLHGHRVLQEQETRDDC